MTPTPPPTSPPPTFRDLKNREWTIRLDFGLLRRIRTACDLDLGDLEQLAMTWAALLYDDLKAADVLWLTIAEAAATRDVDRDAFDDGLDGDALQRGLEALKAAIENFTQPRKRGLASNAMNGVEEGMRQAIAKNQNMLTEAIQTATSDALRQVYGPSPPSASGS